MIRNRPALLCALLPLLLTTPAAGQPVQTRPRPSIIVEASYPGANARVIADTVAAPIEEQVKGVAKMLHMVSRCRDDGSYRLMVTFAPGADIAMAQVLVQNRASLALPVLPDLVKRSGVTVKKAPRGVLLVATLTSPDGTYDTLYLSNYTTIQIKDELARLAGVGDVVLFGQRDDGMRIWLDPAKLAARALSAADVDNALRAQNLEVLAGQVDKPLNLKSTGRLANLGEVQDIILKTNPDVRLKDVARVELAATKQESYVSLNGRPGAALSIYLSWQARPQEVRTAVQKELARLRAQLGVTAYSTA